MTDQKMTDQKMVDLKRRSPLAHRDALQSANGALRLSERPFLGKLILRLDRKADGAALAGVLGVDLPPASPMTAAAGDLTLLWLGPDEWMIVTPPGRERDLADALETALAGRPHQIVIVSDQITTIELDGARAREVLMKLSTLDLHARAFKAGEVRGTLLARANAILHLGADAPEPVFGIFVRWSMADYLWCLIANAGREFGLPPQAPVDGERLVV